LNGQNVSFAEITEFCGADQKNLMEDRPILSRRRPITWNSLPEYLRDPELSIDSFWRQLKTFLLAQY